MTDFYRLQTLSTKKQRAAERAKDATLLLERVKRLAAEGQEEADEALKQINRILYRRLKRRRRRARRIITSLYRDFRESPSYSVISDAESAINQSFRVRLKLANRVLSRPLTQLGKRHTRRSFLKRELPIAEGVLFRIEKPPIDNIAWAGPHVWKILKVRHGTCVQAEVIGFYGAPVILQSRIGSFPIGTKKEIDMAKVRATCLDARFQYGDLEISKTREEAVEERIKRDEKIRWKLSQKYIEALRFWARAGYHPGFSEKMYSPDW